MYITREIEQTIDTMLEQAKVVLVSGARQVGKTTMLKHHLGSAFTYVSLEDPRILTQAKTDVVLFFDTHVLPLIIDEVQRAPELFSSVKWQVDQSNKRGQVILTGSQTYHLMKGVSESLAGRIRVLEMPALSLRELSKSGVAGEHTTSKYVPSRIDAMPTSPLPDDFDLWRHIHRGSMPELQDPRIDQDAFFADYVRTYLERDVRDLTNVKDEVKFYNFLVACAARSGQLFNATDIGNAIDADHKTVKTWLSVLQASGIVHLLEPFWSNVDKRLAKTPKIYFMDTGLVCHLTRWSTPEQLKNGAVAGHVFETFVVSEVLKSHMNAGANMRDVWFYRDSKKREIDLVIQNGHTLHPIEIKIGALVQTDACKNFRCLDKITGYELGFGHVICQTKEPYLVSHTVQAVPVWTI